MGLSAYVSTFAARSPKNRPCFPLTPTPHSYWGALANSAKLTGNLEAWFIDRDGARVGQGLVAAVRKYAPPGPQLSWKFIDPDIVGDDDAVQRMVLNEQVWVAVVGEYRSDNLGLRRVSSPAILDACRECLFPFNPLRLVPVLLHALSSHSRYMFCSCFMDCTLNP